MWNLNNFSRLIAFTLPIIGIYYYNKNKKYSKKNLEKYFENKNIIITGSSQGIGKHLSETLQKYNCRQFLLARSFTDEKIGNIAKYKCDCSSFNSVNLVMDEIFSNYGHPDILINCAGTGDWKYITEMSTEEVKSCIDAPLMSSIWITRKVLINRDDEKNTQILFIQSPTVIQPWKSTTAYSASRWGLQGLILSLRADYYNNSNIKIKDIIFGKVDSRYFINNPTANQRMPELSRIIPTLKLTDTSREILKALIDNNETTVKPKIIKLLSFIHWLFPKLIPYINYRLN